jgi:hypothetical protein
MSNGTDNFPKMPPYPAKPKAAAERAVSPAESVRRISDCEAYNNAMGDLVRIAAVGGAMNLMNLMEKQVAIAEIIDAMLIKDHNRGYEAGYKARDEEGPTRGEYVALSQRAEGAKAELAKEKERADRLDNALKEWLDKTQWVQDAVQSSKFGVIYLGYHRADVIRKEFDKLAQPLQQDEESAPFVPAGYANETEFLRQQLNDARTAIKAHQTALQQEGGKDALVRQAVLSQAAYHVKHGYKSAPLAAKLESLLRSSDNLQQASTTQVEPAKKESQ